MNLRALTPGELEVLKVIRDHYGPLNVPEIVIFSEEGDAIIWVKADDGSIPLMANLSNLAAWRADGSIASEEELRRKWLRIE